MANRNDKNRTRQQGSISGQGRQQSQQAGQTGTRQQGGMAGEGRQQSQQRNQLGRQSMQRGRQHKGQQR